MPSVEVNRTACTGCGVCVETCPPDVLRMDEEKKAVVFYPASAAVERSKFKLQVQQTVND